MEVKLVDENDVETLLHKSKAKFYTRTEALSWGKAAYKALNLDWANLSKKEEPENTEAVIKLKI